MFLLTSDMIHLHQKSGQLDIRDIDPEMMHPTYYYFRMGQYVRLWPADKGSSTFFDLDESGLDSKFELPPRAYARIVSHEQFKCSKRVLGLIGQISELPKKGLRLNHSPTIDPNFDGRLEMGIENLTGETIELRFKEPIGKVSFFDISDTYPIPDIAGTRSEDKYRQRAELKQPSDE